MGGVNYLLMLVAGALLCNGLPHLISGVRGERFFTPWARGKGMASALENVLWGSANLVIGVGILTRTANQNVPHGLIALVIGFVAMGCGLALLFSRWRAK